MDVFDRKVKRCGDCQYSFPKSEKNTSEYLYCGKVEEYIPENGFVVLDNCPFKYKNSFTDEQFERIGFYRNEYNVLIKTELHKGIVYSHALHSYADGKFNLIKFGGSDFEKNINIKALSFPHLKFILDSLI